jgi:putative transposase
VTTLLEQNPTWPAARLCRLLDVPRSSLYYKPSAKRDQTDLCRSIESVAGQWPRYGVRRVTHELRRGNGNGNGSGNGNGNGEPSAAPVGHRRVHRLMRQMGLCAKAHKPRKKRTTNSEHPFARYPNRVKGVAVHCPDQIWVSDITYIALGSGFVYLAVIMDVFTRSIRGWFLSRSLDGDLCRMALSRALSVGTPEIHHSDQGVQYAADGYVQLLKSAGVEISMAAVGSPEDNGYAERLMRTIKEEHVSLTEYNDFEDARQQIGRFLDDVYPRQRIHSALAYLTPAEFESRARKDVK